MKKRLLLIALAGMMVLTACNKQKENQGEAQFTATTEHQGGRTSLNPNNGNITWTSGDQIVIANDNDETAVFSLQSGEGTTEGGFGTSGEFNTVGPFIAAYPSDAVIGNDKVTFNLTATQAIENTETFANGANPMVACSDDKNLSFKNLCGGLGIRLKGVGAHVSAVRITSKNTSEKLWGAFEVSNCAANEPTLTEASGNQGSNVITLTCDVTLTTAAKTFFVMLPPGTLANGFTMEVMDGDEVLATKETTSDVAFVERNLVKVFNEILIDVEFDGNVEIPTGMSNSNIIVTNLSEDAIPDENGDFAIGYSKSLIATNATNGEIVYMSILSVDNDINKGERQQQSYELSARETALYYALTMIPFGLNQTKDETFQSIKDVLYDLACVQALENAIEQSVNQNGYLMPEDIGDELNTVWNYLEAELLAPFLDRQRQMTTNNDGLIVLKQDGTVRLEQPHLANNGRARGIRIDINNAHFNESSNTWTLNMTGYSDNGVFIGIQKGGFAQNGSPYPSSGRTPYFLPPMNMGKFMGTFTSFSGLKAYFSDTWRLFFEDGFGFDDMTWDQAKLEGITFELNKNENALFMRSPMDDQATAVVNGVYVIMQAVGIALDDYLTQHGCSEFFTSLFSNQELCATIGGLVGHPENFQTAANALLDWAADLFATGAFQQYINPRYNVNKLLDKVSSGTARAAVTYVGNNLGTIASLFLFDSFVFRVYAEYNSGGGGGNAPTGAINGKFTINANGDQVYFSKGNLQYQASTNTWRFATNQWDYVGGTFNFDGQTYGNVNGSSNNNISSSYNGWIDLFGWGTSGYNHGANAFQPWSISDNSSDYWAYGQSNSNLYDGNGQADWGYNAISNGGNAEGMWRTLTIDEWNYLFYNRPTLSGARFVLASVNNVGGLILLPDDWNISVNGLNNINVGDLINHPNDNIITANEWTNIFEANGAVFLPGAGTRYWQTYPGAINYENSESADGFYWSSNSNGDQNYARMMYFYSNGLFLDASSMNTRTGLAVRLVRNAN